MSYSWTEARTRQEIIDKRLALAGWNVDDPSQIIQELDIYLDKGGKVGERPPRHPYQSHRFADYALVQKGRPAAVLEAKKTSVDARLGQEQAITYARDLQQLNGGPLPFATYTNGHDRVSGAFSRMTRSRKF